MKRNYRGIRINYPPPLTAGELRIWETLGELTCGGELAGGISIFSENLHLIPLKIMKINPQILKIFRLRRAQFEQIF